MKVGLIIMGAIALYVVILAGGIFAAAKVAKRNGRNPWVWGAVIGLAIYLPLFWDHIPTVLAHKYYCENFAGFQIHKTPDQWKAENPGVAETLTWRRIPVAGDIADGPDGIQRHILNERIVMERRSIPTKLLSTVRHEERFIDTKSNDVLAKRVVVSSGYGSIAQGGDIRTYKFWLSLDPCIPHKEAFSTYYRALRQIGNER